MSNSLWLTELRKEIKMAKQVVVSEAVQVKAFQGMHVPYLAI